MNPLDLFDGLAQRNAVLDRHAVNHREDIQKVRVALLVACQVGGLDTFTADDVFVVAERMGLTTGDTRWLGSVTRNWNRIRNTGRYQPSTLKQRHARPIPVWAVEPL